MPRSHGRRPVVTPVVPERIDERSVVWQQCKAWSLEVAKDLGGFENLSTVEIEILDEAARLRARLLAAWAIDLKDEQPLGTEARERLKAIRGLRGDLWRACRMLGLKRAQTADPEAWRAALLNLPEEPEVEDEEAEHEAPAN